MSTNGPTVTIRVAGPLTGRSRPFSDKSVVPNRSVRKRLAHKRGHQTSMPDVAAPTLLTAPWRCSMELVHTG